MDTLSFLVGLIGMVASICGVYYAYQAVQKAADAEAAAQEATRAATRRAAQDELTLITRAGDDLLRSLEGPDWPHAAYCSRQMLQLIADFEGQHRGSDLLEDPEFGVVEGHIKVIYGECVKMARDATRATDRKRISVHDTAGQVVQRLARLLGNTKQPPTV